jgi:uncharacterized protein (TIGR02117 family)
MKTLPLLKRATLWIFYLFCFCITFILGYFGFAYVLSRIPVNTQAKRQEAIDLYILTNGVHTDLILPVKTPQMNWSEVFPYNQTMGNDTSQKYIGIGWGDKGFYLNTPTWDDLTFSTAFNAVFGLGGTAVHTTYHGSVPEDASCIRLSLSPGQYQHLIQYIQKTLKHDEKGNPQHIQTNANYGSSDAFYEANGRYSMFFTCNTWTNKALEISGQKACWWTPFQSGIFYQYTH